MCVSVCVRVYTQIITNLSHWHNIIPDSPTVPRPSPSTSFLLRLRLRLRKQQ